MRVACLGLWLFLVNSVGAAELLPFDVGSPARIRDELRGRPYVLAFWSVYCAPCREEMPQWKRLRDAHPGLTVVLVAADDPAQRDDVRAFLASHDLGDVRTYLFDDAFSERIRFAVDTKWRGELPRTYYFDQNHRVQSRSGKVSESLWSSWLSGIPTPGR